LGQPCGLPAPVEFAALLLLLFSGCPVACACAFPDQLVGDVFFSALAWRLRALQTG
jgi:hypothetical protein